MRLLGLASAILIASLVVVSAAPTVAHSPLFPVENHTIDTAMLIDEPERSFAVYHDLEPEEASYYEFHMDEGARILVQVFIPYSPEWGFVPSLALLIPGGGPGDDLPEYVEVPEGYRALVTTGDEGAEGELEPFTPGPVFLMAEIDVDAPVDGQYYAVVYSGDEGGAYTFVIGYLEGFTAQEILALPINLITIYQWEGQELWQALAPYILMFVTGLALAIYGYRKMGKPESWVKWLALISSLAFLGSSVSVVAQLAFSFARVPFSITALLSLGFALVYLILALVMARFAYKRKPLRLSKRALFFIVGIVGLGLWGGLYIGPILALIVAFAPPYRSTK